MVFLNLIAGGIISNLYKNVMLLLIYIILHIQCILDHPNFSSFGYDLKTIYHIVLSKYDFETRLYYYFKL